MFEDLSKTRQLETLINNVPNDKFAILSTNRELKNTLRSLTLKEFRLQQITGAYCQAITDAHFPNYQIIDSTIIHRNPATQNETSLERAIEMLRDQIAQMQEQDLVKLQEILTSSHYSIDANEILGLTKEYRNEVKAMLEDTMADFNKYASIANQDEKYNLKKGSIEIAEYLADNHLAEIIPLVLKPLQQIAKATMPQMDISQEDRAGVETMLNTVIDTTRQEQARPENALIASVMRSDQPSSHSSNTNAQREVNIKGCHCIIQ